MKSVTSLRVTLADNLARLSEHRGWSQNRLGKESKLGQGRVGAIMRRENDATLATLGALADALDVQPWQLLVPKIDPRNLPLLKPMTEDERRVYEALTKVAQDIAKSRQ